MKNDLMHIEVYRLDASATSAGPDATNALELFIDIHSMSLSTVHALNERKEALDGVFQSRLSGRGLIVETSHGKIRGPALNR